MARATDRAGARPDSGRGTVAPGGAAMSRHALLGIDTGGTFTDAVLIDAAAPAGPEAVIAKAKARTTPEDLAIGIRGALGAALDHPATQAAGIGPGEVALVSLSTTLATNALVEGQGRPTALVAIGFAPADTARAGLAAALGPDPLIAVAGGHDAMGAERAPLDLAALKEALDALPPRIEAVAVCGHFAVRNPAHEEAARAAIRARTDLPVTCSHRLTARIGGPRRALTALLNARLTALIDRLLAASEGLITAAGIRAPLMVVRGDGALVAASHALERPVETILSGPAASLVGAAWLTGLDTALVADIGGTTTDIAVLRGGCPALDPDGAEVGGHRTLVEAVAMRTHGLGGDSWVGLDAEGGLRLGPRRAIPVAVLASFWPERVHAALERDLGTPRIRPEAGRFLVATGRPDGLGAAEAALMARLADGPVALAEIEAVRADAATARRLLARGALREGGPTPTDAACLLGLADAGDRAAAEASLKLLARQKGPDGRAVAPDPHALAERIIAALVRRSAEHAIEAALAEDGVGTPQGTPQSAGLAVSALGRAALDGHRGLVAPSLPLTVPLVGLGASAPLYYPRVAALLQARPAIPEHADVANAIGAVVGSVTLRRSATVTVPSEGRFRAHLPVGPEDFATAEAAEDALRAALAADLRAAALGAGAEEPEITENLERREAEIEGRVTLIETELTLTATGRPRLAADQGREAAE